MKIINWEKDFFVHDQIILSVKRVDFVSDRVSYIVLGVIYSSGRSPV